MTQSRARQRQCRSSVTYPRIYGPAALARRGEARRGVSWRGGTGWGEAGRGGARLRGEGVWIMLGPTKTGYSAADRHKQLPTRRLFEVPSRHPKARSANSQQVTDSYAAGAPKSDALSNFNESRTEALPTTPAPLYNQNQTKS